MAFVQSLLKFVRDLFPLVLATVISAVLVSTLHLTSDAQARRGDTDVRADSTVYVDVMPHINRNPVPFVRTATQPGPTDAPFPPDTLATLSASQSAPAAADATPVKAAPHLKAAAARGRPTRTAITARANASVTPKAEPTAKVEPVVAKVEPPTTSAQSAPTPPMPIPPMQIASADMQTVAPEPRHVFGMTVPPSVVSVGGKVVGVARFPITVAEVAVPSPVVRIGLRIVEKVAGAAGSAISDFSR